MHPITTEDVLAIAQGYAADPAASLSLRADAYTDPTWHAADLTAIFSRTWQWVGHAAQLAPPGSYLATTVAGMPIAVVRDRSGTLRAFYNVCKHRAHELLSGSGTTRNIVCPYHAWTYELDGSLRAARRAPFATDGICLDAIGVEEFAGCVYVNLDPSAISLARQAPDLAAEIDRWAPDVAHLVHAGRLTYELASNWKNVVDNFLECYHCHIAHREFVDLVDMSTYQVRTHGIWSSHFADAGTHANAAYDVAEASVTTHAVWWLWPNTCLLRYPGRGNLMVLQILPDGPERTRETWDFFLESAEPTPAEVESIRYIDEVLQQQDIALVESVQRGMRTPAFEQGRIVVGAGGSGLSEHAVHHFHGLVLAAYRSLVGLEESDGEGERRVS